MLEAHPPRPGTLSERLLALEPAIREVAYEYQQRLDPLEEATTHLANSIETLEHIADELSAVDPPPGGGGLG